MEKILKLFLFTFCVGSLLLSSTEGARILGFFPSPSKSHLIIHCSVSETLAQAGHDVTVISPQPNVFKKAKYNYIQIEGPQLDEDFANSVVSKPKPMYQIFPALIRHSAQLVNETLNHPTMQKFLKDHGEGSFDLVLIGYFMNDFSLGLAAHFKCPVAVNFMIRPIYPVNKYIGNPEEVAYVPLLFSNAEQPLDFFGRVKNFLGHVLEAFFIQPYMDYKSNFYYNYNFPADRYPSLAEMRKNVSLVMVNHHSESQGPIRPNVPSLIEIGGIQIKEKSDPLPEDIAEVVQKAKKGFVYFSMGSIVQGKFLDKEKVQSIFKALSKLPYTVLWKWGEKELPGTSPNIVYKNWLPQDDILAQPNCKLFITHGGQGSVVEAQYHGVPMVGTPFFGDQPANMAKVVSSGFGLSVDFKTITEESFSQAVNEVLRNPKYSEAVKKFSRIYRDRPMTPRQKVNYWIDYVLRYKGAKHIQSPSVHLNAWQLLSLDVFGFLTLIFGFFVGLIVFGIKVCCCRGKGQKQNKASKAKRKQH